MLQGVRAVLAASFERIHRSNLVGMGVLPLQFMPGQTWQSLGLTGEEMFDIAGRRQTASPQHDRGDGQSGRRLGEEIRRESAHRHAGRTGLLPQRRHSANRAAEAVAQSMNPVEPLPPGPSGISSGIRRHKTPTLSPHSGFHRVRLHVLDSATHLLRSVDENIPALSSPWTGRAAISAPMGVPSDSRPIRSAAG